MEESKRPRDEEDEVIILKRQLLVAQEEIEDFKKDMLEGGEFPFCHFCAHNTREILSPECVVCGRFLPCKLWCVDRLKQHMWLKAKDGEYVCSQKCMEKEERLKSSVKYNKRHDF